jgi:hypothetical protein
LGAAAPVCLEKTSESSRRNERGNESALTHRYLVAVFWSKDSRAAMFLWNEARLLRTQGSMLLTEEQTRASFTLALTR